jgi:hypothetical protein
MTSKNKSLFEITWTRLGALGAIIIALLFPIGYFIRQGYVEGLGFNSDLANLNTVDMQIWGFYGFVSIIITVTSSLVSSLPVLTLIFVAGSTGILATKTTRVTLEHAVLWILQPIKRLVDKLDAVLNPKRRMLVFSLLELIYVFCSWATYALIAVVFLIIFALAISALPDRLINIGKNLADDKKEKWERGICSKQDDPKSNKCEEIIDLATGTKTVGIVIYRNANEIGVITKEGPVHRSLPSKFEVKPYEPEDLKNK